MHREGRKGSPKGNWTLFPDKRRVDDGQPKIADFLIVSGGLKLLHIPLKKVADKLIPGSLRRMDG